MWPPGGGGGGHVHVVQYNEVCFSLRRVFSRENVDLPAV